MVVKFRGSGFKEKTCLFIIVLINKNLKYYEL